MKYLEMRIIITHVILVLFALASNAQENSSIVFKTAPSARINLQQVEDVWMFGIKALGDTVSGNLQYGESLKEFKEEIMRRYPRKEGRGIASQQLNLTADTPSVLRNFQANTFSGIPNDNTLAISNGNKLLSAINTTLYIFDIDSMKLLKAMTLNAFSAALSYTSTHRYDPKLMYDPDEDRFILVFLAGASSDTKTHIILGFSESSDPLGNWFLYTLPGNPLPGDTSWTDYPAVALSKEEFFVTGNLLRYGGTWQESFKQSVIWQMDKKAAYRGDSLDARLHYNIQYDGRPVRNIHPVQGGDHLGGPDMYFLSNRNFDVQNDTFFLIHASGLRNSPSTALNVRALKADRCYGAPPLARQAANNTFETNDARVLGAFHQNGQIQFVANTIDTNNGFAAVYHGIIRFPQTAISVKGVILTDTVLDFGYPKITYTGTNPWEDEALITFNHSSPNDPAGMSAIFYKGNGAYSMTKRVHSGNSFVNMHGGLLERWGDYSGSQRKYNEPGIVWVSGYHGEKVNIQRQNQTWVAELRVPAWQAPEPSNSMTALAFPNPATEEVVFVELYLPEKGTLSVDIYDIAGRHVGRLHEAEEPAGFQLITFSRASLSRGTYILYFNLSGREILSRKLIVP